MHSSQLDVRSLLASTDSAPMPIVVLDQLGMVTEWNVAVERLLGWSRDEMLGRPFFIGTSIPDAGNNAVVREEQRIHKDGRTIELQVWTSSLADPSGECGGMWATLLDITERKQAERRLAVQNAAMRIMGEEVCPGSSIHSILDVVCSELNLDMGAFWLAEGDALQRKILFVNPRFRISHCEVEAATTAPGTQLVVMSRDSGEPVWLENFGEKIACGRCGRGCQNIAASAICIPILLGKRFWGALEFSSHNRRQVDPATIACLNGIGSQIANRVERELAQQRLLESEKRYRVIFDHAGIGVTGASLDGKLCQMNPAFLNMLGYDEQELQGRTFGEITHPDDLLREKLLLAELLRGERSSYVLQKRYIRKSGMSLWVQVTVTSVNEEPKFFIAVVENIDEQRSAQEQLRRSEERYRLMVEGSEQVFFYEHDAAHRLSYVSPSVRNVLGYEPDEMLGRRYDDFVGDDASRDVVTECTDSAMVKGERGPSYTVTARHKSGYPVNIELTEAPVHNEHGESVMLGFARDVTVRTVTEERLLLSDQILNAVDSIVLVADAAGKIIYANPFATKVLGYPTEQILGFGWWALISPGPESPLEKCQRIARQARGEAPASAEPHEELLYDRDGNPHWILWSDAVGPGNVLIGTGQEITKRKLAEQALEERTARLDALVANIPTGIVAIDRQHCVTMCNPEFERLFQYREREIAGQPLVPLIVPDAFREESASAFQQILAGNSSYLNVPRIRKDGSELLVELHAVPLVVNGDVIGGYAIYRDVTERARAENALRESEARLELFFSQSLVGAFFMTLDEPVRWDNTVDKEKALDYVRSHHRITKVNQALAEQYRTTPDKLMGNTPEMAQARCSVYDREFTRMILDNNLVEIETEDRTYDGASLWTETDYITIRDSEGRITGHFGMQRNITAKKALEQQLMQSQKMEAVGRLAGGVAHDFNNMLTVIRGYSELMLRKLPQKHPMQRYATAIMNAADRSATITHQLLAFSRRQVLQLEVLNLNTVVGDMSKLLRRLIGEDIELRVLLASDLGMVKADPGQMGQILLNLAVNARDAMPDGGRLIIESANVELDDTYAGKHLSIQPGSYVMLGVTDTGCGIDPETRSHIFEPFFTTKEQGKGTGLGLATVYGIVSQSGGSIYVYSEKNEGTTFKIYLPRTDANAQVNLAEQVCSSAAGRTILLIEDEDEARAMLAESLTEQGYNVLSAASGKEALDLCEPKDTVVDIVLSDVVLAGMNGQDLAGYLAARFEGVKVLYMSGFSHNNLLSRNALPSDAPFLQKPFRMVELFAKLDRILFSEPDEERESVTAAGGLRSKESGIL